MKNKDAERTVNDLRGRYVKAGRDLTAVKRRLKYTPTDERDAALKKARRLVGRRRLIARLIAGLEFIYGKKG